MKKYRLVEWIPLLIAVTLFVIIPVVLITSGGRWRVAGPQPGDIMYSGLTAEDIAYLEAGATLPPWSSAVEVVVTPAP